MNGSTHTQDYMGTESVAEANTDEDVSGPLENSPFALDGPNVSDNNTMEIILQELVDIGTESSEYEVSDDESLYTPALGHTRGYTLHDHTEYFTLSLANAMDSLQLDKSLVVQAQLSGKLNDLNQKLIDKQADLQEKLKTLNGLYSKNFVEKDAKGKTSIESYRGQLKNIERRIEVLKYGDTHESKGFMSIFKNQRPGVVRKYPVEYHQARDKVVERQVES